MKIYSINSRKLPSNCYFIQESGGYRFPFYIKRQQITGNFLAVAAAVDEYTAIEILKLLNKEIQNES